MPASIRRAPRAPAPPRPQTDEAVEAGPPAEPAGAPPLPSRRRGLFRAEASAARGKAERPRRQAGSAARWPWADVVAAAAVAVGAAFTSTLPGGLARLAFGAAMLLFVPGYLLLQAFAVPAPSGRARLWQALGALGVSPAVVGLLALSTSIVQGGFRLGAIVVVVTVGCLGFATAALVRRRALAHAADGASDAMPSAAPAATAKSGPVRP